MGCAWQVQVPKLLKEIGGVDLEYHNMPLGFFSWSLKAAKVLASKDLVQLCANITAKFIYLKESSDTKDTGESSNKHEKRSHAWKARTASKTIFGKLAQRFIKWWWTFSTAKRERVQHEVEEKL